jgi:hypothetical protein
MVEISMDEPLIRLRLVGFVGNEDWGVIAETRHLAHRADCFALRARAGKRDAPAHLT